MKILLVTILILMASFLLINPALADTCSDYKQKTGLDLNEAECYVLERVEKGEIAHFKKTYRWDKKYQEGFTIIENRTLRAAFLERLLTDSFPEIKVTNKGVRIDNARLRESLNFEGATIPFDILLYHCVFEERVDFSEAQFSAKAEFFEAQFSGEAYFSRAQFSDRANFRYAQFLAFTSFVETQFSDEVYFSWAAFSKGADFTICKFKEAAYFRRTAFPPDKIPNIIFVDVTDFSNMHMEWEYNPKKFGEEEDGFHIKRRGLKGHLIYNETFYIALIKNYRDMGWFREADDCYYTYRVEKRKHREKDLIRDLHKEISYRFYRYEKVKLRIEWLLIDLPFGYAIKPWHYLRTFIFFWLPFSFYYLGFVRSNYGQRLHWWKAWNPLFQPSRYLWSLIYSLDTLTPGINFDPFATINSKVFIKRNTRWVVYAKRFQQILGWYWAALFLILFSRVWIR